MMTWDAMRAQECQAMGARQRGAIRGAGITECIFVLTKVGQRLICWSNCWRLLIECTGVLTIAGQVLNCLSNC